MEGVTLCSRVPLFVPKERKGAEYLQKLMKPGNNLCTSKIQGLSSLTANNNTLFPICTV